MLLPFILITLVAVFGHSEDFLGTTLLSRASYFVIICSCQCL